MENPNYEGIETPDLIMFNDADLVFVHHWCTKIALGDEALCVVL
jgi:hypothetical protein